MAKHDITVGQSAARLGDHFVERFWGRAKDTKREWGQVGKAQERFELNLELGWGKPW